MRYLQHNAIIVFRLEICINFTGLKTKETQLHLPQTSGNVKKLNLKLNSLPITRVCKLLAHEAQNELDTLCKVPA